jgi:hypothetical protein
VGSCLVKANQGCDLWSGGEAQGVLAAGGGRGRSGRAGSWGSRSRKLSPRTLVAEGGQVEGTAVLRSYLEGLVCGQLARGRAPGAAARVAVRSRARRRGCAQRRSSPPTAPNQGGNRGPRGVAGLGCGLRRASLHALGAFRELVPRGAYPPGQPWSYFCNRLPLPTSCRPCCAVPPPMCY